MTSLQSLKYLYSIFGKVFLDCLYNGLLKSSMGSQLDLRFCVANFPQKGK